MSEVWVILRAVRAVFYLSRDFRAPALHCGQHAL